MTTSSNPVAESIIAAEGLSKRESLEDALRQAALRSIENQEVERTAARKNLIKLSTEALLVLAAVGLAGFAAVRTPNLSWARIVRLKTGPDVHETEAAPLPISSRSAVASETATPVESPKISLTPATPVPVEDSVKHNSPVPAAASAHPPANFVFQQQTNSAIHSGKRQIALTVTHELGSWVDLCTDGHEIVRKYLPQQGTLDAAFSQEAVLRLGNSGGVEVSVDGRRKLWEEQDNLASCILRRWTPHSHAA